MTPGPPRETHSLYKISEFDVEVEQEARRQRIQGRQTRFPGRLSHADGLVTPSAAGKGLVYADMFNLPPEFRQQAPKIALRDIAFQPAKGKLQSRWLRRRWPVSSGSRRVMQARRGIVAFAIVWRAFTRG
jgi:hypothetical protein